MKKTFLLLSFAVSTLAVNAQTFLHLSGTSYSQSFDAIGSGLPTGWYCYSGSSSTSIGSVAAPNTSTGYPSFLASDSTCNAEVLVGGFKNFPSATVSHEGDDYCATTPPSYTNRALGVRQVSPTNASHPNLDSGAAFVLEIANTEGLSALNLTFKLQSLDTASPRVTTWMVDYGFGSSAGSPTTFTPATTTTGTFTTGGNSFSNNTCTVNFGSALNNSTNPVYIRIVTLDYSSGSGNRASSAIDDYSLSWTGTPSAVQNISAEPVLSLTAIGQATSDKITLEYGVETEGAYALNIYDLTGRVAYTETMNVQAGHQTISVNGLHLAPGMYIAKMNNGNSSSIARIAVQ